MKTTLLLCGKLFDGVQESLQPRMEMLICGDRIEAIGRNLPRGEDCEIIDLSDATVTPGMIDAHVHADAFDNDTMFQETIFASSTYRALGTLHTAEHALRRGFTSLRLPGTIEPFDYGVADVARSIERGYFQGSRLVYSFGALGVPGGHTDLSQRLSENPCWPSCTAARCRAWAAGRISSGMPCANRSSMARSSSRSWPAAVLPPA